MYAAILLLAQLVPGELVVTIRPEQPTLAATCPCQGDGECVCPPGECDCGPKVSKPIVTVVRKPRIDDQSPITLAPDPAYDDAIAAFTERHAEPGRKVWTGTKLPPENPSPAAVTTAPRANATAQPPASKTIPPIEKAVMRQVLVCRNGMCAYEWQPVASQPTKSVQTPAVQQRQYQRRGLLGFRRR